MFEENGRKFFSLASRFSTLYGAKNPNEKKVENVIYALMPCLQKIKK